LFSKLGLLDERKESDIAIEAMKSLTVKTNSYAAEPSHLSGGNQQKVLLARALISKPKILLLDEPTKGVDVGARQEIYEVIRRIQASGTSVIVVASDLDELLSLANRVVVMAGGKSVDELAHCITVNERYDFIYIDGSHVAKDVLTDACMAWPLLKQGGLLVFDDYLWGDSRDILHRPRLAVDFFANIFAEELDIVHIGHQFAVRKK
jgi:energy-coupling factor transporter ATP-binding protein EcfA2